MVNALKANLVAIRKLSRLGRRVSAGSGETIRNLCALFLRVHMTSLLHPRCRVNPLFQGGLQVDAGGCEGGMAELMLDLGKIGARGEQPPRMGVPERMHIGTLNADTPIRSSHHSPNGRGVESFLRPFRSKDGCVE